MRIKTYQGAWYGFILSRHPLKFKQPEYLVKVTGKQFFRYEFAGVTAPGTWSAWTRNILYNTGHETPQWQEYSDSAIGTYRAARILDNQLESILFVAPTIHLPERSWLTGLFVKSVLTKDERLALLTGKPPLGTQDVGTIVCSCFNVGEKTIQAAIKDKALKSHQEVGHCLKAGTNCGSCIPEIKALF